MASTNPSHPQRRKHAEKPRHALGTLTRSNSSFLGTIKDIVTAPLSWFSSTDDFEDSKDPSGKRRRLQDAPTEPAIDQDDRATRNKRIRVHSPSHDFPQHSTPYLDPPANAFPPAPARRPPPPPPSARPAAHSHSLSAHQTSPTLQELSNNLPTNTVRSTLSPMRHLSISRTMSLDPPARTLSRGHSIQNVALQPLKDVSMEPSSSVTRVPTAIRRDNSMPPLTLVGRPSFRMRSSLTPQPHQIQREFSEPPTLSSLNANPVFVRGPTEQHSDTRRESSARPVATLGALVDSVRSTKSPVRQHSSLLLGGSTSTTDHAAGARQQTPAERALQELDVYRTPLLPTRLRSANSVTSTLPSSSSLPDMFRSRRASNLVLMQDDRKSSGRLGRRVSGETSVKNDTKPYAGQGGMKKLLARRKQEVEEEEEEDREPEEQRKGQNKDVLMDGTEEKEKGEIATVPSVLQSIAPSKADWYSEVSRSTSASSSSLRVGRTKISRNHIARPTRPVKNTFSAVFEDDGDDAMEDEKQEEREREKRELEEAAKKAPLFEIPAGFSFSKEVKPIEHDLMNAKEPPISSLPFSFSKPSPSAATVLPIPTISITSGEEKQSTSMLNPPLFAPFGTPLSTEEPSPSKGTLPTTSMKESATTGGGVPNFFAKSSALSKPLDIKAPPPLQFGLVEPTTTSTTSAPTFSFPSPPVKDTENPLWDGEKGKDSEVPKPLWGVSNDAEKKSADNTSMPIPSVLFNSTQTSTTSSQSAPAFTVSAFSPIGGDSAVKPAATEAASVSGPVAPEPDAAKAFAIPQPSNSLFSSTTSKLVDSTFTPAAPLFGDAPKRPSASNHTDESIENTNTLKTVASYESTASIPKSVPFSFAPSADTASASTTSSSTSLFGKPPATKAESSGSTFGGGFRLDKVDGIDKESEKEKPSSTAFSFTPSSTSATSDSKSPPAFSFGVSSTPSVVPAASAPFSFGGAGTAPTDVSITKPFAFDLPSSTPVERPVTPPRNPDQEFRMEESPTREMQQSNESNKPVEPRPTLNFSFNTSAPSSSIFGGQTTPTVTSSPFTFGSSTPTSNPFATKDAKADEPKPFGGFSVSTTPVTPSTGFTFGASADPEPPRPSTAGSFSFASAPTSASGSAPFSFGAPSTSTTNPFGQAQSGSAPSSPSTFSQASPFAFGQPASLPAPAAPFAFGSQPASPAAPGTTVSLPPPGTPGGFGSSAGSGFGQPAPSSPFSAPTPLASKPSSGAPGALFTIGAAPTPNPAGRQIKKLPNRRGGKR